MSRPSFTARAPLLTPAPTAASTDGRIGTAIWLVIVVAALYFGRDILIPMALAALLSFMLEPLATRLRRIGLGRAMSVLLVVALLLGVLTAIGVLVGKRVMQLAENLPTYQYNIKEKIRSFRTAKPDGGVIDRAQNAVKEIGEELNASDKTATAASDPTETPAQAAPVPVTVQPTDKPALEVISNAVDKFIGPVGVAGLVIVFLIFMLFQQEDIRNRFIRLVGGRDLTVTTQAIADAAQRVSRYLLMQLVVNVTYGIPIGVGLYFIGVPNAFLWGFLAIVLRFIPYAGPVIAAMFPLVLAVAVDPGWSMVLWTVALFIVVELISNNIVEPWLYGSSTGLSPVAIILAAIFWTTIWGPAGLLLSTPLTVCLVVLGRYVQPLQFLSVLLGDAPALSPHERLYQRMLADDTEEGEEIASVFLESHELARFHEEVTLPALRLAEEDRRDERLTPERAEAVSRNMQRLVEDLAEDDNTAEGTAPKQPLLLAGSPVLCIGSRSPLDTAAAAVLAHVLRDGGIAARAAAPSALEPDQIAKFAATAEQIIVLVHLGPSAVVHARQLCRRLRRRCVAKIVIALFNDQLPQPVSEEQRIDLQADHVALSPGDTLRWIDERAREALDVPMAVAPIPDNEAERLAALEQLNILDTPREEAFDRITASLKQALGMRIALISLIDEKRQFWKSSAGLPQTLDADRQAPRDTSICGHVVALDDVLVVDDILSDPRFANNPFLRQHGIRFYAGVPLRTRTGSPIGSLCVMDLQPRQMTVIERSMLQLAAKHVMREFEWRAQQSEAEAPRPAYAAAP